MAAIKIFYLITSSDFGGAETLLYQTASSLDRDRYEILVCSIKPKGAIAKRLETQGVRVESLDWDASKDIWAAPGKIAQLIALLNEFKPHILHASLFQADVLGAFCGAWAGVRARIATVHMVMKAKWPQLLLERLASFWITHTIAVSQNIKDIYTQRLGLSRKKISVIYNVVDEDETISRAGEINRVRLPLLPQMPWFAVVGRLNKQKGLNYLLQAVRLLKERNRKIGVVLVGDGPEKKDLEALTQKLELTDRVYFAGFQLNAMPYIGQSQGLAMSSDEEGLPFVLIEAMVLGKPIIATRVGAIPEAIEHRKSGILVPRRDPRAMAEAMDLLVTDPALSERLGEAARQSVRERFSIKRAKMQIETLYATLAK